MLKVEQYRMADDFDVLSAPRVGYESLIAQFLEFDATRANQMVLFLHPRTNTLHDLLNV